MNRKYRNIENIVKNSF